MTKKVNGYLKQGAWFERDTCILTVTATNGIPFSMPVSVAQPGEVASGGTSEKIMNIMQTRGTVIAYTVESDTVAHFMYGHAAGFFTNDVDAVDGTGNIVAPPSPPGKAQPDVIAELKAMLDGLPNVTFTIEVFEGFKGAVPAEEKYRSAFDTTKKFYPVEDV